MAEHEKGSKAKEVPLILILATVIYAGGAGLQNPARTSKVLSCDAPFGPDATAASLMKVFGAANVATAGIEIGEGDQERGTVLFRNSPEDRLEILWVNANVQQFPRMVIVRARKSSWRTRNGLAVGVDLRTLERVNRRPFRLLGFGWDYGGTTMSWSGGSLDVLSSAQCRIRARLEAGELQIHPETAKWYYQVAGDREFSSGHPAMQALNPKVYEVFLDYAR